MSVLKILTYPNKVLREPCSPILCVTEEIEKLIDDMAETMYASKLGMGISAPQVGVSKRVFVVDTQREGENGGLKVFINPVILSTADTAFCTEGCLSFPGMGERVKRAGRVAAHALDRAGKPFILDAEGILAVAIQHETDHLNGVLFIDHLTHFVRDRVKRQMAKLQRRRP
jgi:peptide deformylase